jgi:Asp-tRNA(Asn)/Glu-tRNA(Gln) amidotransferase A subunit family amidase
MADGELCFLNVAELAPLIRQRAVSPVEIVEALLSRIEQFNDGLRAYLCVSGEQALAAARAAAIEIAADGYRGALHGVPVAYKYIYHVRGLPTTAASKVMAGYVAAEGCTVADAAMLLQIIAGPDRRDPSAALQAVPDYQAVLGGDLQGIRLGVPGTYFFDDGDPDVMAAVRGAIETMQQLGAVVHALDLPHACYGPAASWAISYSEAFAFHRANFFARPRDYTPAFLHKISGAAFLTAEECIAAQRLRQVITSEFMAALTAVDAIVTPTTAYPAHPIGGPSPQADMRSLTRPVSLTGLPALAMPCGFTRSGLPVGMQLIGRAWEEGTVLRIGHAYEQAAGWHRRRPPIRPGIVPATQAPAPSEPTAVDAQWVLDFARLTGLSFVDASDAEPIAASIGPVKAMLAEARQRLQADNEPPVRPAPA